MEFPNQIHPSGTCPEMKPLIFDCDSFCHSRCPHLETKASALEDQYLCCQLKFKSAGRKLFGSNKWPLDCFVKYFSFQCLISCMPYRKINPACTVQKKDDTIKHKMRVKMDTFKRSFKTSLYV